MTVAFARNLLWGMLLIFSVKTVAQSSANASISANIVSPVTLHSTTKTDLFPGDIKPEPVLVRIPSRGKTAYQTSLRLPFVKKRLTVSRLELYEANNSIFQLTYPAIVTATHLDKTAQIAVFITITSPVSAEQQLQFNMNAMILLPVVETKGCFITSPFDVMVNYN